MENEIAKKSDLIEKIVDKVKIIKIIITENNFFFFLITPATFSNKFGLSIISFSI